MSAKDVPKITWTPYTGHLCLSPVGYQWLVPLDDTVASARVEKGGGGGGGGGRGGGGGGGGGGGEEEEEEEEEEKAFVHRGN